MKTVLITGASRGIGKATAQKFLEKGWKVIGTSTSGKISFENKNLVVYKLDLFKSADLDNLVGALGSQKILIDVLVNNSGIQIDSDNEKINIDELRKTLEVNLIGLIDLTQRLTPLINKNGHVINVSSALGGLTEFFGVNSPSYQITKSALNMFTKILAEWLDEKKIIVSALDPGWVKTDLGGANAFREPHEPANEIYDLATTKVETGEFWFQGKKRSW